MSDEPQPVGRFDWERLVDRAEMPGHLKATAYVLAHHANNDGSHVRCGRERLADILDISTHTAGVNREALVAMGWLRLVKRGGGRNGEGTTSLYQLTDPGPEALIFRLDPDGNRLVPRKAGKRPPKRAEVKPTSPEKPVDNPGSADLGPDGEAKPTSHENEFQVKPVADSGEVGFALPLFTTTPRVSGFSNHPQLAGAWGVDKANGIHGVEPPRAPPAVGAHRPKTQPRKRRKR